MPDTAKETSPETPDKDSKTNDTTEGEVAVASPQTPNLTESLKKGEELVTRLEEANKIAQELAARKLLGGETDSGTKQEEKKEETPAEYAARILKDGRDIVKERK